MDAKRYFLASKFDHKVSFFRIFFLVFAIDALQVTGYTISSNGEKINNCHSFLSNLERSMVLGAILLVLPIFSSIGALYMQMSVGWSVCWSGVIMHFMNL